MKSFKKSLNFIWVISLWLIFCSSNNAFSSVVVGQWYAYEGHEYAYTYQDVVGGGLGAVFGWWSGVEANAVTHGAHLAAINSEDENNWIFDTFGYNLWIGYNFGFTGSGWDWSNGDPVSYENWGSGQPITSSDKYGAVIQDNKTWSSLGYKSTYTGIMERPATVPLPSALWLLGSGILGVVGIRRKFQK